ncbi:MAG: hypothetical protein IJ193_01430 [Bacilli bacterium]|nr:hypothetical protein [Bacilli bacterium]
MKKKAIILIIIAIVIISFGIGISVLTKGKEINLNEKHEEKVIKAKEKSNCVDSMCIDEIKLYAQKNNDLYSIYGTMSNTDKMTSAKEYFTLVFTIDGQEKTETFPVVSIDGIEENEVMIGTSKKIYENAEDYILRKATKDEIEKYMNSLNTDVTEK